jgi:hypothetical protein
MHEGRERDAEREDTFARRRAREAERMCGSAMESAFSAHGGDG